MDESTVKAIFHKRGIVRILKILIHKRICDFDSGLRTLYRIRPMKLKAIRPGNLKEKFDIEKMELDSQRGNNLNGGWYGSLPSSKKKNNLKNNKIKTDIKNKLYLFFHL